MFHCLVIKILNLLSLRQLVYFITFISACQVLFSSFFEAFLMFVCRSQATRLLYHILTGLSTTFFAFFKNFQIVYSEETIRKLASILEAKQKEFGTVIYLISDEPYRELAYDGVQVPYLTKYYANTIVGYSYSKSLSLPGERIGYLVIPDEADGSEELIAAAAIANRTIGCVNAPSLIQKVIAKCVDAEVDVAAYDKNRLALYNGLKELGFECIKPQGAFYLFVKSPVADEKAFCEAGKKYNILMVPGSSFACPGYVRLAYCVSYDTIMNSLPQFGKLAEEFGLKA